MWNLLQSLWIPRFPGVGPVGSGTDVAGLIQQYKQAQATATAVTNYYNRQVAGGKPPEATQTEAISDLIDLSQSKQLTSQEVATVKDILKKAFNSKSLDAQDIQALKNVVKSLGAQLVAAAPDTAQMPAGLKATIAASPNADRALQTFKELKELQAKDTHAPPRLTDDTIRILTEAVAKPRTEDVRGQAGIMNRDSALRAARALVTMPDEDYKRTMELVTGAAFGAKDPDLERALLLKAVAAKYKPPGDGVAGAFYRGLDLLGMRNGAFINQLKEFAGAIHGKDRQFLVVNTTLVGAYAGGEGLQQRFGHSCGPTTIQMTKGELDPMYALEIRRDAPVTSRSATGKAANEQREILTVDGSKEVLRADGSFEKTGVAIALADVDLYRKLPKSQNLQDYGPFTQAMDARMGELKAATPRDEAAMRALGTLFRYTTDYRFQPNVAEKVEIQRAMADLKQAKGIDINLERLNTLRGGLSAPSTLLQRYIQEPEYSPPPAEKGQILHLLAELRSQGLNISLTKVDTMRDLVKQHGFETFDNAGKSMDIAWGLEKRIDREFTTQEVWDANNGFQVKHKFLDQAAAALEAGKAVPFGIRYKENGGHGAGHFMLMSDVRGTAPGRQFLISDPMSGKTGWVREADVRTGDFAKMKEYGFDLVEPALQDSPDPKKGANIAFMYFPKS